PDIVVPWGAIAPLYLAAVVLFAVTVSLVSRQVRRAGISTGLGSGGGEGGSLSLAIRRFRDGRAAVLGLVVLVLVTAVCAAIAPRLFDRFADDALRGEVRAATPFQRNIQLVEERLIAPGNSSDPMSEVAAQGDSLRRPMPSSSQPLFRDTGYL